jgi:glycosyltransferase involved in cell wall biosynthesis
MPLAQGNLCIAHIISALGHGGMENSVIRLAIAQKRLGHQVHVICVRELGPGAGLLVGEGVPVHLSHFRARLDPGSLWRLGRLLHSLEANVVQTHNYRPNVSGTVAAKLVGIPAIFSTIGTVNRWDTRRQFWMDRFLSLCKDGIICVSREVRDRYFEKMRWNPERYHVVHNGIDPGISHSVGKARHLYERYRLNEDDVHIVSIARLVKIKDHATLLRAHARVVAQKKDARLLLLGDGPLREILQQEVERLSLDDHVRFLGHQTNVAEWLSIADASVLCTHVEGFSLTVLESMAAGVPTIATDVGGNREAIEEGVTGFLTPPGDEDAVAEKLLRILNNPARGREIGERAREVVRESFTIEATARKSIDLYHTILRQKGYNLASVTGQ